MGVSNWYVDEIQMIYQPIAPRPSAIPTPSNLFNLEVANQSRWDLFLFNCYPQQEFRDGSGQELNVFCSPRIWRTLCMPPSGPAWVRRGVDHVVRRGSRGMLQGRCSGAGCVCLLVVQVLGVGVLRVPHYLLWRKFLHQFHSSVLQKYQPRGRPVQCLQR